MSAVLLVDREKSSGVEPSDKRKFFTVKTTVMNGHHAIGFTPIDENIGFELITHIRKECVARGIRCQNTIGLGPAEKIYKKTLQVWELCGDVRDSDLASVQACAQKILDFHYEKNYLVTKK